MDWKHGIVLSATTCVKQTCLVYSTPLKLNVKKNVVTKYEYAWKYIIFYLQISSLLNYNTSKYSNTTHTEVNSMSPRNGPLGPHSPLYSSSLSNSNTAMGFEDLNVKKYQ
jgi:hypothetical protein